MERVIGWSLALLGMAAVGGIAATPVPATSSAHEMNGVVKRIDKTDGDVSVDADGRELRLHFPPGALRDIREGDRVTVSLAIREAQRPSSGTPGGRSGAATSPGTSAAGENAPAARPLPGGANGGY